MIDEQSGNIGRDNAQYADPKGVNAALSPGNGTRQGEDAASAAQVFSNADHHGGEQAVHAENTSTDLRGSGMHMMETASTLGGGAVGATREVLRGAIGATEDVASGLIGGVSHIAADLVHGVRDVGYEVRDGATGLIGAVGVVGGSAVHAVTSLLVDVVDGVRHVVGAAMGHNGNGHARTLGNGEQRQMDTTRQRQAGTSDNVFQQHNDMMPPPSASQANDPGTSPRL